jgi:hypothetical protein
VRVDLLRLGELREVLTEFGEDRVDAARLQPDGGLDCIVDLLTGHELAHGEAHESSAHRALSQPRVG